MARTKRGQAPRPKGLANNVKLVEDLCGVSDPFCKHAYGAKSPDAVHAATIGYTLRHSGTLTTSTIVPQSLIFFRASVSSENIYRNQTLAASSFPATTQTNIGVGTHPSFVQRARIVSAAVRVWPVYAMTASQGVMSVIPINDDDALFDGAAHTFADLQSSSDAHLGKMEEFQFNLTPLHDGALDFKEVSNNITVTGDVQDWTSLLLIADGTATTLYLAWEIVIHYEGIVDATDGHAIGNLESKQDHVGLVKHFMIEQAHKWGGIYIGARSKVHAALKSGASSFLKGVSFQGGMMAGLYTAGRLLPFVL
jgi:hypothetical protein